MFKKLNLGLIALLILVPAQVKAAENIDTSRVRTDTIVANRPKYKYKEGVLIYRAPKEEKNVRKTHYTKKSKNKDNKVILEEDFAEKDILTEDKDKDEQKVEILKERDFDLKIEELDYNDKSNVRLNEMVDDFVDIETESKEKNVFFAYAKKNKVYKNGKTILVTTKNDILPLKKDEQGLFVNNKSNKIRIPENEVAIIDNLNEVKDLKGKITRAAKVNKIIGYALSQTGKPYIWGATGPKGFDCSGLTTASFKQIGVTLPRCSYHQAFKGQKVLAKDLQPGDLLFFNITKNSGHVGIYLGEGQFVHAPKKGDVVKVTSLKSNYSKNIFGARRYV